ncbi:MAG: hypothetical protein ACOYOE_01040 [Chlorobium sp.]
MLERLKRGCPHYDKEASVNETQEPDGSRLLLSTMQTLQKAHKSRALTVTKVFYGDVERLVQKITTGLAGIDAHPSVTEFKLRFGRAHPGSDHCAARVFVRQLKDGTDAKGISNPCHFFEAR